MTDTPTADAWDRESHRQFHRDMTAAGFPVREYRGRDFYHGPAVATGDGVELQDVIWATKVRVQWDSLGRDEIVYPRS